MSRLVRTPLTAALALLALSLSGCNIVAPIVAVAQGPGEVEAVYELNPDRKTVIFVDDLNMPEVDLYGTASPHTVMRQHLDYDHWYDRQKHTLKIVSNTQYMASMNPKAGSFTINPRLQRLKH